MMLECGLSSIPIKQLFLYLIWQVLGCEKDFLRVARTCLGEITKVKEILVKHVS